MHGVARSPPLHAPRPSLLSPPARPQDDERMLQDIQRFYNTVIEELPSNVADLI